MASDNEKIVIMKKLTFKNKKEFAEAIIKYGRLYNQRKCVFFDPSYTIPFRLGSNYLEGSLTMDSVWNNYNQEWYTEQPLQDKDLVMCWDTYYETIVDIRFYDAKNQNVFGINGDRDNPYDKYDNYTKLNPSELPEVLKKWYDKVIENLKD